MKIIGWFELYNDYENDIVVEYVPFYDMEEWIESEKTKDKEDRK